MQTRSSTRATDPISVGFESLIALSAPLLAEQLKSWDYKQIQDLCRYMGVSAKGARAELESRILECKAKVDSGEVLLPSGGADSRIAATAVGAAVVSTPERRDGRKRSPHRGNTFVSWPAVAPLPAYDPMEGSDPWKQYASQRGPTVHSGMSPQLLHERQTLEAFLADTFAPSLPPIPTPAPIQVQQADSATVFQAILDGQAALLQGVNELRANAVTKQHLQTFHALQSQEMRTYVQAELAPVHAGFKELGTNMGKFSDRLDRIESGASSIGNESAGFDPRDPAFRRVAFIGFPKSLPEPQRIEAIVGFMQKHFADIRFSAYMFPDKDGMPTVNGYIEVNDKKVARRITNKVKAEGYTVDGLPEVSVKPALTDIDRHRNWALREAERLVRASPNYMSGVIKVAKGDGRGIYVDGVPAFTQKGRFTKGGTFHGVFSDISLP